MVVEGLSLFVPPGTSALVRERMAHLHREAAKWRLYEFDEREDRLKEIDFSDHGNIATRLVHWSDERAVRERFADSIAYVCSLMGEVEIAVISAAEIGFRCHGLEFARARLMQEQGIVPLCSTDRVWSGSGRESVVGTKQRTLHNVAAKRWGGTPY